MGHIANCWVPLQLQETYAHPKNLPEGRSLWPCSEEIQHRPDRWWSTAIRLSCWSPLQGGRRRSFMRNAVPSLQTPDGEGYWPEVVRGRVPRWLQVGGVLLLGGEPTVKRTVRGLADPPWCCTLGPAGALKGGHTIAFHLKVALQQKMLMMSWYNTCVHWSLRVQAVGAALIGLSTQSDSDWLLRQTTRTDRSASTTTDSSDR